MRLISENEQINLSFDNWDLEISSPYLTPPIYYIKATTDHRNIIISKFKNVEQAIFVLNEIQKCNSNGSKECRISEIKERIKNDA